MATKAISKGATIEYPPYSDEPKAIFDFYFDAPQKMASALYWLRTYMNTLSDSPYDIAPEFMQTRVLIHGTEIVTLVKKNYKKYPKIVERMRYYEQLGVKFTVCLQAAEDYGYQKEDFYDFVSLVPSAMTEIIHWQNQGYGLIRPVIMEKKYAIEEIR